MILRLLRRLAAILIMINIVTGSLYPVDGGLALNIPDKLQHLIAYLALAFVLGLSSQPVKRRLIYLGLAVGLGAIIEIVQPYVGREMSFYDFMANFAGVAMGGALGIWLRPLIVRLIKNRFTA